MARSERDGPRAINQKAFREHHLISQLMAVDPGISQVYKDYLTEKRESFVERMAQSPLPIYITTPIKLTERQRKALGLKKNEEVRISKDRESMFNLYVYFDKTNGDEHVAIIKTVGKGKNVPIRIHSSCLTGESFHASNCDCHEQLNMALAIADDEGLGGVIWLYQEGRGNGLAAKAKQLRYMIEEGLDTISAFEAAGYPGDRRDFTPAVHILQDLGISSIRLITNNPDKIKQTRKLGIKVSGRIPCEVEPKNEIVKKDLRAKRDRHGHMLKKTL